jgi:hypothetical protein
MKLKRIAACSKMVQLHTANLTMAMLAEFSGEKVISKNLWPPQSLDLKSPDFYLWGYLRQNVYMNNPHTLKELNKTLKDA